MYFIYGLRLVADLSLYFFFANLITKSLILSFVPAVAYVIYLIASKKLDTSWDRQSDLFAVSWKLFLVFGILACLVGKSEVLVQRSLPMAILSLTASVLLLRMLRHSEDVYLNKQYQFKNLLLLGGVLGATWILSSDFVLRAFLNTCSFFYTRFVLPILTLIITCITFIIGCILRLFSWLHLTDIEFEESHLSSSGTPDPFKDVAENMIGQSSAAQTVLTIIGIVIALVAAFFLLRWLSSSEKNHNVSRGAAILSKNDIPATKHERSTSLAHQVRRQYRKFLKLYKSTGERISSSDTSADIMLKGEKHFSAEMMEEIREIYIRARYNHQASKEDLKKLRQMNQILKQKL